MTKNRAEIPVEVVGTQAEDVEIQAEDVEIQAEDVEIQAEDVEIQAEVGPRRRLESRVKKAIREAVGNLAADANRVVVGNLAMAEESRRVETA